MLKKHFFSIVVALGFLWFHPSYAQQPDNSPIWEKEIKAFEESDNIDMPQEGGIVFTGSSSIRGWRSVKEDFPGKNVINRGFGGSRINDATFYFDRIVAKYNPQQVVLYSGDNDVASGKNAEMVFEDFKAFVKTMREKLPKAELLYLSIKPSTARWHMYEEMAEANKKIKRYAFWHRKVKYVDVSTDMLGEDGKPKPELLLSDGLHMTREGYDLWTEILKPYLK